MKKILFRSALFLGIVTACLTISSNVLFANDFYSDVEESRWYFESIDYVTKNGIMSGISTTEKTFDPTGKMTRAMIVMALYNMEGKPEVEEQNEFIDVKDTSWCANAITWAKTNNIVNGYTDGSFGPNNNISKEELAKIIYGFAKFKNYDVEEIKQFDTSIYKDFDNVASWAKDAMVYCLSEGIINGSSADSIAPQNKATRAEAATIFMKYDKGYKKYLVSEKEKELEKQKEEEEKKKEESKAAGGGGGGGSAGGGGGSSSGGGSTSGGGSSSGNTDTPAKEELKVIKTSYISGQNTLGNATSKTSSSGASYMTITNASINTKVSSASGTSFKIGDSVTITYTANSKYTFEGSDITNNSFNDIDKWDKTFANNKTNIVVIYTKISNDISVINKTSISGVNSLGTPTSKTNVKNSSYASIANASRKVVNTSASGTKFDKDDKVVITYTANTDFTFEGTNITKDNFNDIDKWDKTFANNKTNIVITYTKNSNDISVINNLSISGNNILGTPISNSVVEGSKYITIANSDAKIINYSATGKKFRKDDYVTITYTAHNDFTFEGTNITKDNFTTISGWDKTFTNNKTNIVVKYTKSITDIEVINSDQIKTGEIKIGTPNGTNKVSNASYVEIYNTSRSVTNTFKETYKFSKNDTVVIKYTASTDYTFEGTNITKDNFTTISGWDKTFTNNKTNIVITYTRNANDIEIINSDKISTGTITLGTPTSKSAVSGANYLTISNATRNVTNTFKETYKFSKNDTVVIKYTASSDYTFEGTNITKNNFNDIDDWSKSFSIDSNGSYITLTYTRTKTDIIVINSDMIKTGSNTLGTPSGTNTVSGASYISIDNTSSSVINSLKLTNKFSKGDTVTIKYISENGYTFTGTNISISNFNNVSGWTKTYSVDSSGTFIAVKYTRDSDDADPSGGDDGKTTIVNSNVSNGFGFGTPTSTTSATGTKYMNIANATRTVVLDIKNGTSYQTGDTITASYVPNDGYTFNNTNITIGTFTNVAGFSKELSITPTLLKIVYTKTADMNTILYSNYLGKNAVKLGVPTSNNTLNGNSFVAITNSARVDEMSFKNGKSFSKGDYIKFTYTANSGYTFKGSDITTNNFASYDTWTITKTDVDDNTIIIKYTKDSDDKILYKTDVGSLPTRFGTPISATEVSGNYVQTINHTTYTYSQNVADYTKGFKGGDTVTIIHYTDSGYTYYEGDIDNNSFLCEDGWVGTTIAKYQNNNYKTIYTCVKFDTVAEAKASAAVKKGIKIYINNNLYEVSDPSGTADGNNIIALTDKLYAYKIITPTAYTFIPKSVTLAVNETYTIFNSFTPSDAKSTVVFTSSDDSVCKVYGNIITPYKVGTATITGTTSNGLTSTCNVTVTDAYSASFDNLDIRSFSKWASGSYAVKKGTIKDMELSVDSSATAKISYKYFIPITKPSKVTMQYSSSSGLTYKMTIHQLDKNQNFIEKATIANGGSVSLGENCEYIALHLEQVESSPTKTFELWQREFENNNSQFNISLTREDLTGTPTSMNFPNSKISLAKGETKELNVNFDIWYATGQTVTYSSSDTTVVSVSGNKITAKKIGNATITASNGNGLTCSMNVLVTGEDYYKYTLNALSKIITTPKTVIPRDLGKPLQNKYGNGSVGKVLAQNVWDMIAFDNKVFFGNGNFADNSGPIEVYYYDFDTGKLAITYTFNEEQISNFKIINGKLYAPGIDLRGGGASNLYAYDDVLDTWHIEKQIPTSYHMWDVTTFKDHMYIGGSYVGLTDYPVVRIETDGTITHIPFYYNDSDYQKDVKAGTVSNTIHHLDQAAAVGYVRGYNLFVVNNKLYCYMSTSSNRSIKFVGMYEYKESGDYFVQMPYGAHNPNVAGDVLIGYYDTTSDINMFNAKIYVYYLRDTVKNYESKMLQLEKELMYMAFRDNAENVMVVESNVNFRPTVSSSSPLYGKEVVVIDAAGTLKYTTDFKSFTNVPYGYQFYSDDQMNEFCYGDIEVKDLLVDGDTLYVLFAERKRDGKKSTGYVNRVIATKDLENFTEIFNFESSAYAKSMAYLNGYMFIGTGGETHTDSQKDAGRIYMVDMTLLVD